MTMGDPRDIRAFSSRERRGPGSHLAVNVQQDKMLERMKRSLDSERQYALRAIESDKNILRARQLRFRGKVCKIKSHLTDEQILEMKKLDDEQMTRRTSESQLGFNSTRTALGERTKTQAEKNRSHSAAGRLQTRTVAQVVKTSPQKNQSRKVPFPVLVKNQQKYSPNFDDSDETITEEDEDVFLSNSPSPVPSTKTSKQAASHTGNRRSIGTSLNGLPPGTPKKSLGAFSCHDVSLDDDGKLANSGKQSRTLSTNRWSMDETPEEKIRQELRQMILDENDRRIQCAQKHTNAFLEKVNYDMQREQGENEERERQVSRERAEDLEAERMNSKEAQLRRMREDIRKKKRERMQKGHDGNEDMLEREEGETDEDYTARMEKWREDMRRIRYLRRRSQRPSQDFTNVVTLVSAGMAANKIWREGLANGLF